MPVTPSNNNNNKNSSTKGKRYKLAICYEQQQQHWKQHWKDNTWNEIAREFPKAPYISFSLHYLGVFSDYDSESLG